jgi:hypothetical protein
MKTFLTTVAFAAVVAIGSPAFAQTTSEQSDPNSAYAAPPPPDGIVHSTSPAYDVYHANGEYVGSDPDPFIRNDLRNDDDGDGD